MTIDEMDELLIKIEEAGPSEQITIANKLIEELKFNNMCYDMEEYDSTTSQVYGEDLTKLSKILKEKIELQKINSIKKRFENLSKDNQKKLIEEIIKVISNYEKEKFPLICSELEHSFTEWEQYYNIVSKIKKDEKRIIEVKLPYWTRKCTKCEYIEIIEKEPQYLIQKRNEEIIKRRIKNIKEELALLENLE